MKFVSLLALATAALAQSPPQLEVVSAGLNPNSRQIAVTLVNHSLKNAVAWTLDVRQFDAANKQIDVNLKVGTDNLFGWLLKLESRI
jgi:hypothetical protein